MDRAVRYVREREVLEAITRQYALEREALEAREREALSTLHHTDSPPESPALHHTDSPLIQPEEEPAVRSPAEWLDSSSAVPLQRWSALYLALVGSSWQRRLDLCTVVVALRETYHKERSILHR